MACWPGYSFEKAAHALAAGTSEPGWGRLGVDHVQICPQNFGVLDEDVIDRVQAILPGTKLRLHANVRVLPKVYRSAASAYGPDTDTYFRRLSDLSHYMGAPGYTLHSGLRSEMRMCDLRAVVDRLEDMFMCPVGIEGQYPAEGNKWLISSSEEYAELLESGMKYALDLSHLNIVAKRERHVSLMLAGELLASENCIEIHVSDNDGFSDRHRPMTDSTWWTPLMKYANPNAVIFSEGNQKL